MAENHISRIISSVTFYDVLNIKKSNASPAVIKRAYFDISKQIHPDKIGDGNTRAETAFNLLNKAYNILSHPAKKLHYDGTKSDIQDLSTLENFEEDLFDDQSGDEEDFENFVNNTRDTFNDFFDNANDKFDWENFGSSTKGMQQAKSCSSKDKIFSRNVEDKVRRMDLGHGIEFKNDSDDDIFSKLEAGIGNINLQKRTKEVHYGQKEKTKPSPARQPSYAHENSIYKPAMLEVNGRKFANVQHAKCDSDEDPSEKIFNNMHRQLDPNWN